MLIKVGKFVSINNSITPYAIALKYYQVQVDFGELYKMITS